MSILLAIYKTKLQTIYQSLIIRKPLILIQITHLFHLILRQFIWSSLLEPGMAIFPACRCQRKITCAEVLLPPAACSSVLPMFIPESKSTIDNNNAAAFFNRFIVTLHSENVLLINYLIAISSPSSTSSLSGASNFSARFLS